MTLCQVRLVIDVDVRVHARVVQPKSLGAVLALLVTFNESTIVTIH